jgi:hypothetical protein
MADRHQGSNRRIRSTGSERPHMARLLRFAYGSFLSFTAHSKLIGNDPKGSI